MQPFQMGEIPMEIIEYVRNVHSVRFPRQGYTSNVGIIESDQGIYVLKRTMGKQFCSWLNKEISVINCLTNETNLPIPKVKMFVEQKQLDQCWALMECIEGETLRTAISNLENRNKRREMIFNYGKTLFNIHTIPCPEELKTVRPWSDNMLLLAAYNLNHYKVEGDIALLEKIKTSKPRIGKNTLIHGDYTIDNVLVSDGIITGIIDWSGGAYGDPRYDVSIAIRPKPNLFQDEIDRQIFFEGYGEKIINYKEYDYFVNGLNEFF
ncbi:phosphotransferase family protein [Heyndrickxia camelliae]|uniref:Aminoglycoside phosphotransferase APH(3') n=1 Tax=Heyndrickxia camelliae TaxID=1707093 RepID=A0A2N3LHQ2_9BACI|nr:aminoglycoside phosphotransferase family protein [Heyndrickxia camelliae]PKR84107.1 aminoglycoside phosphotransferase APH(3') [Heyndrickxia camelliae]